MKNKENDGASVNTTLLSNQYSTVTKVRNPSQMFSTMNRNTNFTAFKSPQRVLNARLSSPVSYLIISAL